MKLHIAILTFLISVSVSQECGNPAIPPKPNNSRVSNIESDNSQNKGYVRRLANGERIINGEEAIPHSFPWMVSIKGKEDPHYCGASILSPNWVLTAAHCGNIVFIGTYFGDEVAVVAHERETDEIGKKIVDIAEVFNHPQYDQSGSPDKSFDISLLKLKEPIAFSDTIGPPCLPDQGDFGDSSSFGAGMECYLSGWGKVGHGENMPQDMYGQPYKLRQAMLPLVDDESCHQIYMEGANFEIQPTMQCAGGDDKTSCNGDSGGPLVCKKEEDGKFYQVGIVSFGPSPCDASIPAVYTRVAAYTDWIKDTIHANGGY